MWIGVIGWESSGGYAIINRINSTMTFSIDNSVMPCGWTGIVYCSCNYGVLVGLVGVG